MAPFDLRVFSIVLRALLLQADALEFYSGALQQQLRELEQLQDQTRRQLPRSAAFVTFRYHHTTQYCCSAPCLHQGAGRAQHKPSLRRNPAIAHVLHGPSSAVLSRAL